MKIRTVIAWLMAATFAFSLSTAVVAGHKSEKSEKSEKSLKSEKSAKSCKSAKSGKSDKSAKSRKSDKSDKSRKGRGRGRGHDCDDNEPPPPPPPTCTSDIVTTEGFDSFGAFINVSGKLCSIEEVDDLLFFLTDDAFQVDDGEGNIALCFLEPNDAEAGVTQDANGFFDVDIDFSCESPDPPAD